MQQVPAQVGKKLISSKSEKEQWVLFSEQQSYLT